MNAAHFGSAGRVYTPQMVLDGRTELVVAGRVGPAGRFDAEVPIAPGPGSRRVLAFAQERGLGRILGTSASAGLPPARRLIPTTR